MDIIALAKDGLEVIQQFQPAIEAAAKVTTSLGTIGGSAVKLIQQGQKLYTYLVGQPDSVDEVEFSIVPKRDVAVLVDINRRMLIDVATYLQQQQIDANIVIVTNDPEYSDQIIFLDDTDPDEWAQIVRDFNATISSIKRHVGSAKLHFFLSTPLPLAFGLGSVWGTVDEATVYHWSSGTYVPLMQIARDLRQ